MSLMKAKFIAKGNSLQANGDNLDIKLKDSSLLIEAEGISLNSVQPLSTISFNNLSLTPGSAINEVKVYQDGVLGSVIESKTGTALTLSSATDVLQTPPQISGVEVVDSPSNVAFNQAIKTDSIQEKTASAGVTISDKFNVKSTGLNFNANGLSEGEALITMQDVYNTTKTILTNMGQIQADLYYNDGDTKEVAVHYDYITLANATDSIEIIPSKITSKEIKTDIISEKTESAGVTVDSVILKDGGALFNRNGQVEDAPAIQMYDFENNLVELVSNQGYWKKDVYTTGTVSSSSTVSAENSGSAVLSGNGQVSASLNVKTNAIIEHTSENGVSVDSVHIKDGQLTLLSDPVSSMQAATKNYVDGRIASSVNYIGGYDANTNTPDLDVAPTGIAKGDMFTVTAAGDFFTEAVEIGDVLISEKADPTTLADWTVVQKNLDAPSVKTMYESNADTNAYTDAEKTKVGHISVTQSVDLDTMESDIATNNAKISAATFRPKTELFTLDATAITNKYVTLANIPAAASEVVLIVKNAAGMYYGDDFQMDAVNTDRLTWSALSLDGVLAEGDKLTVMYRY